MEETTNLWRRRRFFVEGFFVDLVLEEEDLREIGEFLLKESKIEWNVFSNYSQIPINQRLKNGTTVTNIFNS